MEIYEIIEELNLENGSNYKKEVLTKYKDNELLKKVLKMTYDKVSYTYGVTMKNIEYNWENGGKHYGLETAIDMFNEKLCTRELTGNAALGFVGRTLENMIFEEDAIIIEKILDRDLKIRLGRTEINKVFKNLIVKPPYMRCGIYNEKTSKKISFPAMLQQKADGRFCAVQVENSTVTFTSRSGEETSVPHLESLFKNLKDGVYIGELLVKDITNRSLANGIINSDDEEARRDIFIQLWDYISLDEYSRGKDKLNKTVYLKRWTNLNQIITDDIENDSFIKLIPTYYPESIQEALQQTSTWMNEGYEGSILKDSSNIFLDHTSPTQLKLKLEIDVEMRISGFAEGKKGTKREKTFGAIIFENDEGTIKGQCSGFTDKQLEDFNNRREELIGNVFTVQFNDLTKGRGNEYHSLSHPRFIEIRTDKTETDTLERALELKQMAMELK